MASTKTGMFLPLLVVAGLVAYLGVDQVADTVGDLFGGNDPVIVADDGLQLLVGGDGESTVKQCTPQVALTTRKCGDLKVVPIDAAKMPFISRNIQLAWSDGIPSILTRNSAKQAANRAAACGTFVPKYGGSCDEFSFATTDEGGSGARVEEVPLREQRCQGGAVAGGYAKAGVGQGDRFLVVIANPAKVATKPFTGADDAEEPVEECAV
ncbi:NucA/NucB deoxyribonuclease domain-containing protein [Actinokineospora iranica]|uniref:Deoxyribonuclease NucA/NucB n=1 Tax=Actinokineospora iranica TaxID=1271860 RepID=A0A1G6PCQ8_9PSEU|nr:NucA/NucB deoxyribonuclease domain-containing protein [Actinokineospora iranica]SDC77105.1 Deoxyribonuclease NucA/NucB [Actinokineospora iranica]